MKFIKGQSRVTFVPATTTRGHLSAVGEPVDLTEYIHSVELSVSDAIETMAKVVDAAEMATIHLSTFGEVFGRITIPGWYWHGWVKHDRDLRRARAKEEIREKGWR